MHCERTAINPSSLQFREHGVAHLLKLKNVQKLEQLKKLFILEFETIYGNMISANVDSWLAEFPYGALLQWSLRMVIGTGFVERRILYSIV